MGTATTPPQTSSMILLRLSPALVALLLLAAHFYRSTHFVWMLLCVGTLGLTWVRHPVAARSMQVALWLGSLEWLRTAATLVLERQQAQLPFVRLGLILSAVTLLTALSSLVFESRSVRAYFKRDPSSPDRSPSP